jgi:hypothetical protein
MRLAVTAERLANGLCNLARGDRQAEEELSVKDVVPEPPGKHSGGSQPLTQVAGAGR